MTSRSPLSDMKLGLITVEQLSDTNEEVQDGWPRRVRGIMPSANEIQATESIGPSDEPLSPALPVPGSMRITAHVDAPRHTVSQEELDVLRRQVIALQRISSLGVLAGGVFHEL